MDLSITMLLFTGIHLPVNGMVFTNNPAPGEDFNTMLDNLVTTTFDMEARRYLADSRKDCMARPDSTHGGPEKEPTQVAVLNCYMGKINAIRKKLVITTKGENFLALVFDILSLLMILAGIATIGFHLQHIYIALVTYLAQSPRPIIGEGPTIGAQEMRNVQGNVLNL
jgi:hypothetical protein